MAYLEILLFPSARCPLVVSWPAEMIGRVCFLVWGEIL